MVARGSPGDLWRLGDEALAMGAFALRSSDLLTVARPELEALVRATGETASLEILVGEEVVILDSVEGPSLVGASSEIGTRWPAHATSTGKVLIAARRSEGRSDRRNAGVRRRPSRRLRTLTPHTITDPLRFGRELDRVLERGYATAIEELEVGYVAVGAPVRDHDGQTIAAISIGGPAARLTRARIPDLARRVVRTADRISRHLGGRGGSVRAAG